MKAVTGVAALTVLMVLLAGLWNLVRSRPSPSLSQTLMRWRVGLQFVALLLAMMTLYVLR